MSPLWRDRLAISLAPDGVAAARFARGLVPKELRREFYPCNGHDAGWVAPFHVLAELLPRQEWRNADMGVALSNEFVRYAVLTLDPLLKREQEREAYIRIQVEKRFGPAATDWELRSSPAGNGRVVVSAVERKLLESIEQAAAGHVRWISLQPYLMTAFNRVRHEVGKEPAALLLAEPGRMLVALFATDGCVSIGSRRTQLNDAKTAERLLDEESVLNGFQARDIWYEGLIDRPADSGKRSWRQCPSSNPGMSAEPDFHPLRLSN